VNLSSQRKDFFCDEMKETCNEYDSKITKIYSENEDDVKNLSGSF